MLYPVIHREHQVCGVVVRTEGIQRSHGNGLEIHSPHLAKDFYKLSLRHREEVNERIKYLPFLFFVSRRWKSGNYRKNSAEWLIISKGSEKGLKPFLVPYRLIRLICRKTGPLVYATRLPPFTFLSLKQFCYSL